MKRVHYSPERFEENKKPVSPYFDKQVEFFLGKSSKKVNNSSKKHIPVNNSFQIPTNSAKRGSSGSFSQN